MGHVGEIVYFIVLSILGFDKVCTKVNEMGIQHSK